MEIEASLDRLLAAPAATHPAYDGQGRLYCLHDEGGSAQVWEVAADGSGRPRTAHRDAVAFVAGSPTGGAVFGRDQGGDERVQLHALTPEGEPRALTANPRAIHGWGAISPDGRHVAFTTNDRHPAHADPCVLDLETGTRRRLLEVEGPHDIHGWHPDGRAIVLSNRAAQLRIHPAPGRGGGRHRHAADPA